MRDDSTIWAVFTKHSPMSCEFVFSIFNDEVQFCEKGKSWRRVYKVQTPTCSTVTVALLSELLPEVEDMIIFWCVVTKIACPTRVRGCRRAR